MCYSRHGFENTEIESFLSCRRGWWGRSQGRRKNYWNNLRKSCCGFRDSCPLSPPEAPAGFWQPARWVPLLFFTPSHRTEGIEEGKCLSPVWLVLLKQRPARFVFHTKGTKRKIHLLGCILNNSFMWFWTTGKTMTFVWVCGRLNSYRGVSQGPAACRKVSCARSPFLKKTVSLKVGLLLWECFTGGILDLAHRTIFPFLLSVARLHTHSWFPGSHHQHSRAQPGAGKNCYQAVSYLMVLIPGHVN